MHGLDAHQENNFSLIDLNPSVENDDFNGDEE
jgi:hypothetical protein